MSFNKYFGWIYDNSRPDSLASKMRNRRIGYFKSLIESLPKPVKILDLGGTDRFWIQAGFGGDLQVQIAVLNLYPVTFQAKSLTPLQGNACDLSRFSDKSFDLVFSNSVIEHVGGFEDQKRMAAEVRRVGRRYFIQTPNVYFPMEPHFLFPFFQFFPEALKVRMISHFNLGWRVKAKSREEAVQEARSVRLLNYGELKKLFPEAEILKEKLLFLNKSFTCVYGFEKK